jgi:hypothetical protein
MPDPKALQILFSTYWSSSGWKDKPTTPKADYQYAVAAGVMSEPIQRDHDEIVKWVCKVRKRIDKEKVARAFLASLSSRRLDLRSALGSYAVARHLPAHRHKRSQRYLADTCAICGDLPDSSPHDLNVLNFERFKWGGVRHLDPVYMAFDLERFLESDYPSPTAADQEILAGILRVARSLPAKARLSHLDKGLAALLKSNKNERTMLIHILGYAGILQPRDHRGFFAGFIDAEERQETGTDWCYPVEWWRGSDGVDEQAVHFWFPQLALS